jgi:YidC/Oxa1 family membrane protein insertase
MKPVKVAAASVSAASPAVLASLERSYTVSLAKSLTRAAKTPALRDALAHLSPCKVSAAVPAAAPVPSAVASLRDSLTLALGGMPLIASATEAPAGAADVAAAAAATADSSLMPPLPNLGLQPTYPGNFVQGLVDIVVNFHDLTGLPWWASIVALTFVVRTMTLPINLKQLQSTGRMVSAQGDLAMLRTRIEAAKAAGEPVLPQEQAKMFREVFLRHKASPFGSLGLALASMPVFFGMFWVFRATVIHPDLIPLLQTGGFDIFNDPRFMDLTVSDPYYLAPAISTITVIAMLEMAHRENVNTTKMAQMMKTVMRAVSILSFPLVCNFPLGLFMFWIPSNLFSLCFSIVSRQDAVRRALGIPIMQEVRRLTAANQSTATSRVAETASEQARARAITSAAQNSTPIPSQVFVPARPKKGTKPTKFSSSSAK